MRATTYNELSFNEKVNFYNFLKLTRLEQKPANVNMWDDDWINKKNTLPYILECTDRFNYDNGVFHILFDGDTIAGCSGVYISNFSNNVALAGVRTWVTNTYRHYNIVRDYLLPIQKMWCQEKNIKLIALTFNNYNKNLIQVFKKRRLGEKVDRLKTRNPGHLFYNNFNEVKFPVSIQYTKQWVVYEKLDINWDYDWSLIRL